MPFDRQQSRRYKPLTPDGFAGALTAKAQFVSKDHPMAQLADLVLYPMAKGGYDREYRPYLHLLDCGKLIDCTLPNDEVQSVGVKYSCFDPGSL